ncbi:MAG: hypothetical protein J5U19_07575 [Candidatus Methanoperedens sp.]|nr:hypothetical protein [Candidatus Methanoperedens sp.]MCE8428228.1 hypothetical protein [Candidatus Methanoperedens sp.]
MDAKEIGLSVIMVVSSVVLTYKWLTRLGYNSDPIIILAAMILIGSLAALIVLLNMRIQNMEEALNAKERSLRINIKGVEENLQIKLEELARNTTNTIGEFSKRIYR